MTELGDVIGYLCDNYPYRSELSKARLTKMVYLADWKSVIERGDQMTDIRWFFHNYGPYVDDIWHVAAGDERFDLTHGYNFYGGVKDTITVAKPFKSKSLSGKDKEMLDHVIEQTKRLYWNDFIQLVYSTYPVLTGTRGEYLDLNGAAERYCQRGPNA